MTRQVVQSGPGRRMPTEERITMKLMRLAVAAGIVIAALATPPAAQAAVGDGSPTDSNIRFVGRWDTRDSAAYVPGWAGAYFVTGFTGTTVKLRQRNTIDLYYSIDGGADLYIQNVRGTVNLTPSRLPAGNHRLRVSYRVVAGSYHGDAVFQGLVLDPGARTLPAQPPRGMVEFVGDSITVGTTTSKNALTAYGWLVGEQLGLDHMQVAQGGACLVSTDDGCVGLDRRFVKVSAVDGAADHDFSRYQAGAVVINLGTNDAGHGVSTTQFQTAYTALLRTIRGKYPAAAILALQTFRGRFVPQTQAAVQAVNNAGDRNVFFVPTDGWVPDGGLTDSVHPNDAGHRAIAAKLAPIVSAHLPVTSSTVTSSAVTSSAATGCAVTYKITNQWTGGFGADVTVRNLGDTINDWTLTWTFASGQRVTQAWNATVTQTGTDVSARNVDFNRTIPGNGSVNFGFNGAWTTGNPVPASFALNGSTCTGAAGTASPSPSPSPSRSPSPTPSTPARITVWLAGDSTVANSSGSGIVGWGRELSAYLTANATVVNSAVGGRSVQTWLYESAVTSTKNSAGECVLSSNTFAARWQAMLDASTGMKTGDYLFIQFGINDGDSACPRHVGAARYRELLTTMVRAAQQRGANPVLVTPVAALICSGSTAVPNRGFVSDTFNVGSATGVPVIDLHVLSYTLYNNLRFCPFNGDFTSGPQGAFFANDHTHFEAAGARQIAGLVATAVRDQRLGLTAYLR